MNVDLAQELLNELGSSLESLETQQAALLQFLKDNGILTDEQFAPYLAQAGKASSVRWRAAHVRLERLFATEQQKEEQLRENQKHETNVEQASSPDQEAKTKNGTDSANPAPWTIEAKTNETRDGSAKQSSPEKDEKRNEPATNTEKTASSASKTA